MKALLVEDDPATREMIGVLLALRGHEVAAFADAEAAWELLQRESYPLVILDWMLPAMNGLDLCRRIRNLPDGDGTVVLMMTARSRPDDLALVLEAGANDYVAKPFDLRFFDVRLTIAERQVAEVAARQRAEGAQRLLAESGALLAASLDFEGTFAQLAGLAVPFLADWCAVDMLIDSALRRLAVTHAGREVDRESCLPPALDSRHPVAEVARTGRSLLYEEVEPPLLETLAGQGPHAAAVAEQSVSSYLAVPLTTRGRTLGVLSLSVAPPRRHYDRADLALAEELARRAAVAIDNARLYEEAQQALRERNEALTRLEAVVGGVTESIVLLDTEGVVRYASPATEQLYGVPVARQLGQPFESGLPLDQETRAAWRNGVLEKLALPAEQSREEARIELVRPGGRPIIAEIVGINLADERSTVTGRVYVTRDVTEREQQRRRREALIRVARRMSAEVDPQRLQAELLAEAVALLGADDGTIRRWDESRQLLTVVHQHAKRQIPPLELRPGQGASGQAAERREVVVLNDYQRDVGQSTPAGQAGVRAMIAAPLLYEGRLLGVLAVMSFDAERSFSDDDAELLELLVSLGSAALTGLERARLEGALLAARTAQHELSNQLALTVGHAELLSIDPSLPLRLRDVAEEALRGAESAADILHRLQRITRLEEIDWGPLTQRTIDLGKSSD